MDSFSIANSDNACVGSNATFSGQATFDTYNCHCRLKVEFTNAWTLTGGPGAHAWLEVCDEIESQYDFTIPAGVQSLMLTSFSKDYLVECDTRCSVTIFVKCTNGEQDSDSSDRHTCEPTCDENEPGC